MKTAPLVAASAIGLLLLALATAHPSAPSRKIVPLDFTGIDTLEVVGDTARIQLSSRQAPQLSYEYEQDVTPAVRRTGSRLVIDVRAEGYRAVLLSVPPSIRAMRVQGADIVAHERLRSMQLSTSGSISWSGDIDRLDLRDTADHSRQADDECECEGAYFAISDGHIAELRVRSPYARLRLAHPDTIDDVHAWLGEKGAVSLENARRFDNIHVVSSAAQLPEDAAPSPPKAP